MPWLNSIRMAPRLATLSVALSMVLAAMAPGVQAITGLPDFTELVRTNSPAVVNISTKEGTDKPAHAKSNKPKALPPGAPLPNMPDDRSLNDFFRHFFGDQMPPGGPDGPDGPGGEPHMSLGSGFIVSSDGYVISNYHVVKGADEVTVKLSDRRELTAQVVGADPRSDIAVLKINAVGALPVLRLGSSELLQVGEWVLAIGSPFGFDHSVTAGIVSAKGRSLPNENYVPFIQTDVAINPGNSGGPLFNLKGEVIGVNSQIYSRTGGFMGLSFAIPIDVVMNVYHQIREKGAVSRGWLGVLIQDVTSELAESFHMDKPHGALVSKVLPKSPAQKAGVEAGDVITKFNDHLIATSSDLPPLVGTAKVNDKIPVEIVRAGQVKAITITLGELPVDATPLAEATRPESPSQGLNDAKLKIKVRDPTAAERDALELNTPGVLVEEVAAGPARDAGVQAGDVILQINFKEANSAADLVKLTAQLAPGSRVPMLIHRQGSQLFMALKMP